MINTNCLLQIISRRSPYRPETSYYQENMQTIRITIALAVLLLATQPGLAQDVIGDIRNHYALAQARAVDNAERMLSEDEYPAPSYKQYQYVTVLPGSGRHEQQLMMYEECEENDYGEVVRQRLDFATNRYNYAARQFYEEYLYDAEGRVEFIYAMNPDLNDFNGGELRMYFHKGRLEKIQVKLRNQETGQMETVLEDRVVGNDYKDLYRFHTSRAAAIRKLAEATREVSGD